MNKELHKRLEEAAMKSVHRQYKCKGEYPCIKHMYCEMCEGHNTPFDCLECGAGDFKEGFLAGAQWADQHPVNPWHDASKELPKMSGLYLVYNGRTFRTIGYNKEQNCWCVSLWVIAGDIKYWMPIPELPKED